MTTQMNIISTVVMMAATTTTHQIPLLQIQLRITEKLHMIQIYSSEFSLTAKTKKTFSVWRLV
jgi:hypothetical protein